LLHDFAESVCWGWQGFQPAAHTDRILRQIGFQAPNWAGGKLRWLEGSAWIAERPGFR
jgi:hypothetical protein